MKKMLELEVCTATQCSFIPFTPVPDEWAGRLVRVEVIVEDLLTQAPQATETDELPWGLK